MRHPHPDLLNHRDAVADVCDQLPAQGSAHSLHCVQVATARVRYENGDNRWGGHQPDCELVRPFVYSHLVSRKPTHFSRLLGIASDTVKNRNRMNTAVSGLYLRPELLCRIGDSTG